ncbi:MAG: amidohydrolase family protein, partial [Planctomycetota bacterium]|nr:amidohydrolase family protein [Planctomycetota bacterium]
LRFGLSPHAPYSVHPDLLRGLVDLAREADVPVAMHLAETESELQLLRGDGGEFVEFLQRLGAWHDDAFRHERSVLDCLRELARARRGLVVHGNYLDSADCEFLARSPQLSVVYCPRTHAGFGHTPHPWQLLLVRGINVALGTDSKASNPDLSIWNELLFLHRLAPDFAPAALLELGTIAGARALGLENRVGSIALGKSADLAIIELPADAGTDPYGALFNPLSRVRSSVQAGRWHGA